MIRAAVINAVYPPEPVVSAQMGRDLAGHLAQIGVGVTVLCPYPSRPFGADYAQFQSSDDARLHCEAPVEVVRLPSFSAPQSRLLPRMRESLSFGRHVCNHLERHLPGLNAVYVNSWPLFSQALIARYCARRRIPLILHIKDIYPESLLEKLPRFSRGMANLPLMALDRWIAWRAARVVVISENMRRTYIESRGLAVEKIVTILDWVDETRFEHLPARGEVCVRYGVPQEPFTFLYLGNIGPVAGVEKLIEGFHAADLKHAQLLIVGDGSARAACVARAKALGAATVRFISDPEVRNVPLLQSLGHVCLLPLRKGAGLSSIPSKLMAYLLSAKPVLATLDAGSDTARCIREARCGWVEEPENVGRLAEKMREVASLPQVELESIGQRGRSYGLVHYSRAAGLHRLGNVIMDACGVNGSPV